MRFRLAVLATIAALLLGSLTVGSAALATPPPNPPPVISPVPSPPVIGLLDGRTRVKNDGIELRTRTDTNVAAFELRYPIGSVSGWHYHPGIVIAVVKVGAVKQQIGCRVRTFTAGQSFTEVDPHFVSNYYTTDEQSGAVEAVLEITQIYPADAPARRIEANPPTCRHGVSKDK